MQILISFLYSFENNRILNSDSSSDEEVKYSSDGSNKDEEKKESKENNGNSKDKKKKKSLKKSKESNDKKESLSDLSSDSSDTESKKLPKLNGNSASNSRSASPSIDGSSLAGPSGMKRKAFSMPTDLGSGGNSNGASENSNSPNATPAKRPRQDIPGVQHSFAGVIANNREYVLMPNMIYI